MVHELADWIEKDPVITGSVIRLVNSAAYGRKGSVSSVRHAITILGTCRLRNVVLGLSVCSLMSQVQLPAGWSTRQFNLHAVACANMADLLAQSLPIEYAEGAFVAGLLHDVGKLLLAVSSPQEYGLVLARANQEGRSLYETEISALGFSHAELSEKVVEAWKLPGPVQVAARFHHNPDADSTAPGQMALSRGVQLADLAVNAAGFTAMPPESMPAQGSRQDLGPLFEMVGLGDKAERILRSFEQEMEALRGVL